VEIVLNNKVKVKVINLNIMTSKHQPSSSNI